MNKRLIYVFKYAITIRARHSPLRIFQFDNFFENFFENFLNSTAHNPA